MSNTVFVKTFYNGAIPFIGFGPFESKEVDAVSAEAAIKHGYPLTIINPTAVGETLAKPEETVIGSVVEPVKVTEVKAEVKVEEVVETKVETTKAAVDAVKKAETATKKVEADVKK